MELWLEIGAESNDPCQGIRRQYMVKVSRSDTMLAVISAMMKLHMTEVRRGRSCGVQMIEAGDKSQPESVT
jgi:hypothetical protein